MPDKYSEDVGQNIHDFFKHYRQSGIAFSAFLVSICSALIVWLVNFLNSKPQGWENILIWTQLIFLVLMILSSLLIQYFHYQGYKYLARSFVERLTDDKLNKSSNILFETSNKFFNTQDNMVNVSGFLFIIQLALLIIFFIGKFK